MQRFRSAALCFSSSAAAGSLFFLALLACGTEPRGACRPDPAPGELGSVCGFHNPEDVEWVPEAGLLLVTELDFPPGRKAGGIAALALASQAARPTAPARLWPSAVASAKADGAAKDGAAVLGDPTCSEPPSADFAPHGLSARLLSAQRAALVAVVSHAPREAVELFELIGSGKSAALHWQGCVPLPEDTAGNDVDIARDGSLIVSNYMPSVRGLNGLYYSLLGAFLRKDTGNLLHWDSKHGWQAIPGSRGPNPNGVLLASDETQLFSTHTGSGAVIAQPWNATEGTSTLGEVHSTALGGYPDNLAFSSSGTLLAPTHTSGLAFLRCAFGRRPCRSPWSLFEIDPRTLETRPLLHHGGELVGAISSAVEAHGRLYLGAVFDDRIGVWHPAADTAVKPAATGVPSP